MNELDSISHMFSKNCCVICLFPSSPFSHHDMDSVVDFLVLESLYKTSVCTQWQEGDRFRSHINEEFWFGVVKEKRAFR